MILSSNNKIDSLITCAAIPLTEISLLLAAPQVLVMGNVPVHRLGKSN